MNTKLKNHKFDTIAYKHIPKKCLRHKELKDRLQTCQSIVDEQADDEGCWFLAKTGPESYLQQELRRLHDAVEKAWELV